MIKPQHSPLPWEASGGDVLRIKSKGSGLKWVCTFHQEGDSDLGPRSALLGTDPEALANRELVLRVLGVHRDLVEALASYLRAPSIGSDGPGSATIVVQEYNRRAAHAVLAKARGKEIPEAETSCDVIALLVATLEDMIGALEQRQRDKFWGRDELFLREAREAVARAKGKPHVG